MALPAGIATVTVTGQYLAPDGRPAAGALYFETLPSVVTLGGNDVILDGVIRVPLDGTGSFTVTLVATDAAGSNPTNWLYQVTESIGGSEEGRVYDIVLPSGSGTVDIADIAPADPTEFDYIPVVGPQGPPGVVQSVNGVSQADIVLDAADVGAVASVNGETGTAITLTATDVGAVDLTADVTIDGRKTFVKPVAITSAVQDALLTVEQTDVTATAGVVKFISGSGGQALFLGRGQEHTANTWAIRGDGTYEIGDGTGGRDCVLSRVGPNEVQWTANLQSTEMAPTADSHLTRKDYVDAGDAAVQSSVTTLDGSVVKLTGDQLIQGEKTFDFALYCNTNITSVRLRATTGEDMTLTSTGHAFQLGLDNGPNLRMDVNEIQMVDNGVQGGLFIQPEGGALGFFTSRPVGSTTDTMTVRGNISAAGGVGAFDVNPPTTRPSVTGSRADGSALQSLLTALASFGFITDSTTA